MSEVTREEVVSILSAKLWQKCSQELPHNLEWDEAASMVADLIEAAVRAEREACIRAIPPTDETAAPECADAVLGAFDDAERCIRERNVAKAMPWQAVKDAMEGR